MTTTTASPVRGRYVGAAVAVAIAAVGVILLWGVIALPDYASLSDAPDPSIPGVIATLDGARGGTDSCLHIVAASGASERLLACFDGRADEWPDQLGWTADGDVVVTLFGRFGPRFEAYDVRTGELVRSGNWNGAFEGEPPMDRSPYGDDIVVRHEGGRLSVVAGRGADAPTVLDVEAPRSYTLWDRRWSPDGTYLLLRDSEEQLLLVPSDGSSPPRLLASDVRDASWWIDGVGGDRTLELP